MNEQTRLLLPAAFRSKQMMPTVQVIELLQKIQRAERRQALIIFRKILTSSETLANMLLTIDQLLAENENG